MLAAALAHDVDARLGGIRAETLVLAGAADTLLPVATQRDLAARLVRSRFVVVPDAGHDLSVEAPEAVAAAVLAYVLGA
jgi:pimeloyl-ACP methyl ester carboxylesterase